MNTEKLEIHSNIYYTPEEAATLLRVSRRSILKLLENGAARGVKIGRQWRILGNDLLQLPAQNDIDDRELTRTFMRLSEPAFKRVWDNEEDAVYDDL